MAVEAIEVSFDLKSAIRKIHRMEREGSKPEDGEILVFSGVEFPTPTFSSANLNRFLPVRIPAQGPDRLDSSY